MSRHPALGPPSQPKIEAAKRPSAGADRPQTDSAAGGTSMLNRTGSSEAKGRISQGGDVPAINALADRTDGTVAQALMRDSHEDAVQMHHTIIRKIVAPDGK